MAKISVIPTRALAPKKFYARSSTDAIAAEEYVEETNKLYWDAFNTRKDANGHFDMVSQTIKEFGFSGCSIELPVSFLLAISNRFSLVQVEQFKYAARVANENPLPLFLFGLDMFASEIFRRLHGSVPVGTIAKYMTLDTLRGYNRHAIKGRDWPQLIPSPDASAEVTGMVIFGLSASQRRIIDQMSSPFRFTTVDIRR
jgi:hypothetical protein